MSKTEELLATIRSATPNHYAALPIVLSRAEGVWVWDVEGKRYFDGLSCYGAASLGHAHPKIVEAIKDQLAKGLLICSTAFYHENQVFNARLAKFCGFDKALCMNSGAEAVETFIKFARKLYEVQGGLKNNAEIIVAENNFHGRTTTIISFSSEPLYREGFGPYTPGFRIVLYGDIGALERAITGTTAAVLLEPRQGEGGVIIPYKGYLRDVRRLCTEHGVLLGFDEIQTGFGRTGTLFAWQHEGAKPDALIIAKTLGSCYPVSALLSSAEKMDAVFTPGTHGSTFGNNPLACAIGMAVLNVFESEKDTLLPKVQKMGAWLAKKLRTIKSPWIKEIRVEGLFLGIELLPEAGGARRFCEALRLMEPVGMLCKETHANVLRFLPPLIVTQKELEWAFERLKEVLEAE